MNYYTVTMADGSTDTVRADRMKILGGALMLLTKTNEQVKVYSPVAWLTFTVRPAR